MYIELDRLQHLQSCEKRLERGEKVVHELLEEKLALCSEVERLREELRVLSMACLGVAGRADAARYVKSGTQADH